ncbi:MAG: GNAT family N-acetyltransferase [Armatimonadota bacterium]|nr:GNAT family N-acetyltransferase [Armatimonadota bacterium]
MASSLVIRRLRAEDVEPCARIIAGDPLWQRYEVRLPQARRMVRAALAASRRGGPAARAAGEFAVARTRGQVVGFVWFRLDGTFHHSGYVRLLGVAPHARGRGVGRRLMAHAERRLFAAGPNVFLLCSDFNSGAQAFYEKLGYTTVGAIPDYIVRGVTERLYRKTRGPIVTRETRDHRRRRSQ